MAINESEVRIALLKELVNSASGFMTTTNLIENLTISMKPTGSDCDILEGRSDTRFSQKVRNTVSHRNAQTGLEYNGFAEYDDTREGWTITEKGRAQVKKNGL